MKVRDASAVETAMQMPRRFAIALLPALVLLSSCGGGGETAPMRELNAHRARWEALGLRSYEYTIRRSCFCRPETTGPFRVTVRDGVSTITTRHSADDHDIASVDALFDRIEEGLSAPEAQATLTFDPERGYPISVFIDPYPTMADDEFGYTITEFAPLP
jgi:hypothetical protein